MIKTIILFPFVPLVVTAGYLLYFQSRLDKHLTRFAWFVWFECVAQIVSTVLSFRGINNMPLLYVYVPMGFWLIASFYDVIFRGFIHAWIIRLLIAAFLMYCLIDGWAVGNISVFNSTALSVQSGLVVILAISSFVFMLEKEFSDQHQELSITLTWIGSGLILYHASNILLFYFGKLILSRSFPAKIAHLTLLSHSFSLTVMYLCFFIGLWKSPKRSISSVP